MVHFVTVKATRATSNMPVSFVVQVNGAADGIAAAQEAIDFVGADPAPEGFENLDAESIVAGQVLEFTPDAVAS